MLQLTDRAVDKVRQLMARESKNDYGLRIAVKGGGCSGFQYDMTYEQQKKDNDDVLEFRGLKVFVDALSRLYLDDVTIDYVESLSESGFKIDNPKASGTCGCGSSFSV
jgi:iron-sulfur cluster assembly accessory protein